jgi:hypothetical protein
MNQHERLATLLLLATRSRLLFRGVIFLCSDYITPACNFHGRDGGASLAALCWSVRDRERPVMSDSPRGSP